MIGMGWQSLVRTELKVVRIGCLQSTTSSICTKWRTVAHNWLLLLQYFPITMYQKSHWHSSNPASLFQMYLPSHCSIFLASPHIKDWKKLLQRIFRGIMESIQRLNLCSPFDFKLNLFNNVWSSNKEILVSNYYIFVPFIILRDEISMELLKKVCKSQKGELYEWYSSIPSIRRSQPSITVSSAFELNNFFSSLD